VLLFSNPKKNIFKGIGVSLANLPLRLINSFGDILSYLRLFAVGYATVMVALSCNQMAAVIGFRNIFASLAAALVLFIGHTINLALGMLSVLVHGVRLNMLEFSGHMNIEWSGRPYKPFKE
jgi:V/A-type H+-transporting ATPase subunit I